MNQVASASWERIDSLHVKQTMQAFTTFVFDSYRLDAADKRIELTYSLDDELWFTESVQLPRDRQLTLTPDVDRALFALHLAGGVSYYKTCIPRAVVVRSGSLTAAQAAFWTTLYERGLGEFFYQNDIDFRGRVNFPHAREAVRSRPAPITARELPQDASRFLVPVGGGKDSIVTIELLKAVGADCTLFRSGAHPLISAVVEASGLPLLTIERRLSPELFRLNSEGALNGHVPVTAYLSFLTVVLCLLYDYQFVAMSNERSASEGNVRFHDTEVNHQWSKSIEFEHIFAHYTREYVTPRVGYASLLRTLSELHIARLFSQFRQYFDRATSCNDNWRIAKPEENKANSRWCGRCPKCAFSYVLFAAFLSSDVVVEMFGMDLLSDGSLIPLYRMLLGVEGFKPFECVGTPEETRAAFWLANRRGYTNGPIMQMFTAEVLPQIVDPEATIQALLTPAEEHLIPEALLRRLQPHWQVSL